MSKVTRGRLAKGYVALLERYSAKQLVPVLAQEIVNAKLTNQLQLVIQDINRELLRRHGRVEAEVISAHEITDTIRQQLIDAIKVETGAASVTLAHRLDPGVVGGLMARTPELELNLTIEDKLRRLAA